MAYGKLTSITYDEGTGAASGTLTDLDSGKKLSFQREMKIPDMNRQDIVDYTDSNGVATELLPNLSVKLRELQTASPEVQEAASMLIKAMAKDRNMTDVISKKI